jgi:hypothetical protein
LQKSPTYVAIRRAAEKGVLSLLIYQPKFTKKMTNSNIQELSLQELESLQGGKCSDGANKAIATIGLVAGVASAIPGVGLLIFGPTALGMGIASVVCAYQK